MNYVTRRKVFDDHLHSVRERVQNRHQRDHNKLPFVVNFFEAHIV